MGNSGGFGAAVAAPDRRLILITSEGSHQLTAQQCARTRPSPTTMPQLGNYAELPRALGFEGRRVATGEQINIFLVKCVCAPAE